MLSKNSGHRTVRVILAIALVCLTTACAAAQTPGGAYQFHDDRQTPTETADLTIRWTDPPGDRERQLVALTQCLNGQCGEVQADRLAISGRPGTSQAMEVEVCTEINPWSDRCDVYDCREDQVAMVSICNYKWSYKKSCFSESC